MRRTRIARTASLFLTLALLLLPKPAGAATWVMINGVNRDGDALVATGMSAFADQPFVTLGTDGAGENLALGPLGADTIAAEASTKANGQVVLRWRVSQLTPGLNGFPAVMYGWDFCMRTATNCFELDVGRMGLGAATTNPHAKLWSCADPSCDPSGQNLAQDGGIAVTFDEVAATVTATLPPLVGSAPGALMTPVQYDANGPAFVALGTASPFTAQYGTGDGVATLNNFVVGATQVSLALAEPGLDPATVGYTTTVAPAPGGAFVGTLDVTGREGEVGLYARACLGANNCAYTSRTITL